MTALVVTLVILSLVLPVAGLLLFVIRDALHARRLATARQAALRATAANDREGVVAAFQSVGVRPPTYDDADHLPLYVLGLIADVRGARPWWELAFITVGLLCGAAASLLSLTL